MSFARPEYLWLLTTVPVLALSIALGRIRRARAWSTLAQGGPLRSDGGLTWLGAITLLTIALAQPRWGQATAPPLPAGHDVVILIDASRSMGAEDAVPNRLGVAVESAESLVASLRRAPGNRAAVVAFAGRGVLRCPLTEHLGAVNDALRELKPGIVRPGGTDLAAALDAALDAFDDQEHSEGRAIVLLTDGDDLAGTWPLQLAKVRASRIMVHTVAIGDPEQAHAVPSGKGREPLKYHGTPVLSKRVDRPLEELAKATGGAVVRLGLAPADLGHLYLTKIAPIAFRKEESVRVPERVERYGLFVLGALTLGLAGSWPARRSWFWGRAWVVLACLLAVPGAAPPFANSAAAVDAGRTAFSAGKLDEALAAFETAIALEPNSPVPRYNAAATLFRLERYQDSFLRYREARDRAAPTLRTKIDYALGNTALALGDIPAAILHYDDCLASTAKGASLDLVRADAAINRRFAEEQAKRPDAPPSTENENAPQKNQPEDQNPPGDDQQGKDDSSNPDGSPPEGNLPPSPNGRGAREKGENGPKSAEERLNAALEHVRAAKRRQLPDEPPEGADDDRKDW